MPNLHNAVVVITGASSGSVAPAPMNSPAMAPRYFSRDETVRPCMRWLNAAIA